MRGVLFCGLCAFLGEKSGRTGQTGMPAPPELPGPCGIPLSSGSTELIRFYPRDPRLKLLRTDLRPSASSAINPLWVYEILKCNSVAFNGWRNEVEPLAS